MSDNQQDGQIVAVFETVAAARAAENILAGAGIDRSAIRVIARDEEEAPPSSSVGDQIMQSFMSLFSAHSEQDDYLHAVHRGHALLAVLSPAAADRPRIISLLEQNGAIDFEAQRQIWRREQDRPMDTTPALNDRREQS